MNYPNVCHCAECKRDIEIGEHCHQYDEIWATPVCDDCFHEWLDSLDRDTSKYLEYRDVSNELDSIFGD